MIATHQGVVHDAAHPSVNPIALYWRGEGPLWKVYWLYGVCGSMLLGAVFAGAVVFNVRWLEQLSLLVGGAYVVWILVAVWRCAMHATSPFNGQVARWLTVAWALNVALVVTFVELGLLAPPIV